MFERDAIHERGRALEDEFFHRVDEQLLKQLHDSAERAESLETLGQLTGFRDQKLLEHLLDGGFGSASLAALALVPIVFVAWADGEVSPEERQVVISTALGRGVDQQPTAFRLVEDWLNKRPPDSLWKLWQEYTEAVCASMTPNYAEVLAKEILWQARKVAEASGGTLGFGKISKKEQKILDQIAAITV